MLTYFPTPYPEEWWYSVLCRYYKRSGIKEHSFVKKQLFGRNGSARMGTVFPNGTVASVIKQLPPTLYSTRDILLNHTPFLYYVRMYPVKDKSSMLKALCSGETIQFHHLWKTVQKANWRPRYCPECAREDAERYGESFWHTDHQIPLMTVCPKHRHKLCQLDIDAAFPALHQHFFPLSDVKKKEEYQECPTWEWKVSSVVREYWKMPLTIGPTLHNNLEQHLKNSGYLAICRQGSVTLDGDKLYDALSQYYGKEKVCGFFGDKLTGSMINRLIRWEQLLPDRYILLQVMSGLDSQTIFAETPIIDPLRERIEGMAASGGFHTMHEVTQQLGIKLYELNTLVNYYHIEPFWMPPEKRKSLSPRTALLRCRMEESEFEQIQEESKRRGYGNAGAFALDCVRYVMKK